MSQQAELLWASSKYEVMYYSQRHYNEIRQLMRIKQSYEKIAAQIEAAKQVKPTLGSMRNSCDHMWGYFKCHATEKEKEHYFTLKQVEQFEKILPFFKQLAVKYEVVYLQNSTILQIK